MKIAVITHQFPRLHNTFILNELVELIRLGHEVFIFSLGRPTDQLTNQDVARYSLMQHTYYFDDFSDAAVDHSLRCYQTMYQEQIKKLGKRIETFHAVAEIIKRLQCDFIHGALGNRPATAAMILSELTKIPFSFETHTYDLFVDFPFGQEKLTKASFVMTESTYNREYIRTCFQIDPEKVKIVHLSPNIQALEQVQPQTTQPQLIVSSCRLHPIKGLQHGLQAIRLLVDQFPNLQYLIVGDGPERKNLEELIVSLNLQKRVRLLGDVTNEDVFRVMNLAEIFLLPCVIAPNGDRDGTPTAITEAMYLGKPVVSSNISALPELIEHEHSGLLTEPGNVLQISAALSRLLRDPELRSRLGTNAKQKIIDEFSPSISAAKLAGHWQKYLNLRQEPDRLHVDPKGSDQKAMGRFMLWLMSVHKSNLAFDLLKTVANKEELTDLVIIRAAFYILAETGRFEQCSKVLKVLQESEPDRFWANPLSERNIRDYKNILAEQSNIRPAIIKLAMSPVNNSGAEAFFSLCCSYCGNSFHIQQKESLSAKIPIPCLSCGLPLTANYQS